MALETGTNVGDLTATNPTASDPKSQGDDHLRLLKTVLRQSFAGFTGAILVTGTDGGAADVYTLTPTTALLAYATKQLVEFTPNATSATTTPTLNISALGAKTIISQAGAALLAADLVSGRTYLAAYDGTYFRLISVTTAYVDAVRDYATQLAFATALPAQSLGFLISDGATASFSKTHTGYAQNEVKGADIASAATINLTTATGNLVHVTGTTTITAITIPSGADRTVVFDDALTLTHHSTTLILPTGASITTAAGDSMVVRGDGSGNARVITYTRATGGPVGPYPYLKVSDQKANNTAGGSSLAADITQTRVLNTVDVNTITGASLASNTVTLPIGTYRAFATAPTAGAGRTKLFLYNSSDATYIGIGSSAGGTNGMGGSIVNTQFSITASKNFTLRHYTDSATATIGLGEAINTGQVEVYAQLEIIKVA
jgi:hypothetical protein